MTDIAAVIVNWNAGPILRSSVESLLAEEGLEVLVVDNASSDGSMRALGPFEDRIQVIANVANVGFAGGINQAFRSTGAPFVLILNPDVRARPGGVRSLARVFDEHPRAGAVGGFVNERYMPRRFPTVGSLVRENLGFAPSDVRVTGSTSMRVDQPAGAALMIRRQAYDEVGGFDEQFYPAWYEDVDFCRNLARAGWESYFHPGAAFDHDGGYSLEALGFERFLSTYYDNQFRYARKHFSQRSTLALKAALTVGTVPKILVRPGRAGSYWRVLREVLTD